MKKENIMNTKDDNFHTNVIIEENELLDNLKKDKTVDFICVNKSGTIDFLHVSLLTNTSKIIEDGLFVSNSIKELGDGVYAIPYVNYFKFNAALNNLKDYLRCEYNEENSVIVVCGKYTGSYLECIYGEKHEGGLLFTNPVFKEQITKVEVISIKDFCSNY